MATSIIERARKQGRREGRTQERERIIEWLGKVSDSVKVEPTIPDDHPDAGNGEFTENMRTGALGIIDVLVEKLKRLE
jgi:hypothetical protein